MPTRWYASTTVLMDRWVIFVSANATLSVLGHGLPAAAACLIRSSALSGSPSTFDRLLYRSNCLCAFRSGVIIVVAKSPKTAPPSAARYLRLSNAYSRACRHTGLVTVRVLTAKYRTPPLLPAIVRLDRSGSLI